MNILVVQNSDRASIGILGDALERRGATLTTWGPGHHADEAIALPSAADYDGLIILGGAMNALEDDAFPHLRQAVTFIRQFHGENKPIIGICLGAQLIARAFNSRVYIAPTPEIGFSPVEVVGGTEPTAPEPWLQDFGPTLHLMHWHFDTFELPEQATLLMTNEVCAHQAYRIGSNIYGFQFHFEITPAIAQKWLAAKNNWVKTHYPKIDTQVPQQLATYGKISAQFAEAVAEDWLGKVARGDRWGAGKTVQTPTPI